MPGHKPPAPCGHPRPCGCVAGGSCCARCGYDPDFCIDDVRGGRPRFLRGLDKRDAAIREVVRDGVAASAVAECLGLSERTVFRVLAEAR